MYGQMTYPQMLQMIQQMAGSGGETQGTDPMEDMLSEQGIGASSQMYSPQNMMQMQRMRQMYMGSPNMLGGRTQGMGQGYLPGNTSMMPQSQFPMAQPQQAGLLGAFGG